MCDKYDDEPKQPFNSLESLIHGLLFNPEKELEAEIYDKIGSDAVEEADIDTGKMTPAERALKEVFHESESDIVQ